MGHLAFAAAIEAIIARSLWKSSCHTRDCIGTESSPETMVTRFRRAIAAGRGYRVRLPALLRLHRSKC